MCDAECTETSGAMVFVTILSLFALVFVLHVLAQTATGLPAVFM